MRNYIVLSLSFFYLFGQFSAELIADGFDKPVFVTSHPTNANILYVVEQDGFIRIIKNGIKMETPFLDIQDRVHIPFYPADERGFLGFAFHPNYGISKKIFIHYSDKSGNTVVSSMKVLDDGFVDLNSEDIILELEQPFSNHNGGSIVFGKDDYLYIALGDGGSAGDPENRAQNKTNMFGSILRVDVNVKSGYTIPNSNPFVNNDNISPEIWAYGLRNPWRISFDKLNGDLYIGDVGQNKWEEINWIPYQRSGDDINFGWKLMEGNHCFENDSKCNNHNSILPIFEYPNDAKYIKTILGIKQKNLHGCSVTGGYVYRGKNIPEIYGRYFFGDYCTGKIWSLVNNNGVVSDFSDHTELVMTAIGKKEFYLSSFGEDINGELYIVDYNGSVYKLISDQ